MSDTDMGEPAVNLDSFESSDVSNLNGAAFRIELPSFEGPLDLLLHLIRSHELNILDLPIAFVTERYLEYLELMHDLNLDVASEYLVMAATLVHIKSKTLLPSPPAQLDEEDEEAGLDPREELVRRLLEYQKYKAAAEQLEARGALGRDVFCRTTEVTHDGVAPLKPVGVFALLSAFEKVLKRVQGDVAREIVAERVSIRDKILELTERLRDRGRLTFNELVPNEQPTVYDVVVTLLAILEMAKRRVVKLYQASPDSELYLDSAVSSDGLDDVASLGSDWPDLPDAEDAATVRTHIPIESSMLPKATAASSAPIDFSGESDDRAAAVDNDERAEPAEETEET